MFFKMKPQAWHVTKLAPYTIGSMWKLSKGTLLNSNSNKYNIGDHNSENRPDQAKSW